VSTKRLGFKRSNQLRREYKLAELENPIQGKHYGRVAAGSNLVLLDADVAQAFPTANAVNEALRLLVTVARTTVQNGKRTRPRA